MLDLNLSVFYGIETVLQKLHEFPGTQLENSSTSNSFVVDIDDSSTAGDEDSCSDHRCPISFDILKRSSRGRNEYEESQGFVTKDHFPVNVGESSAAAAAMTTMMREEQWLDVLGGPSEERIMSQQQGKEQKRTEVSEFSLPWSHFLPEN